MKKTIALLVVGMALLTPQEAPACNIPIFRYALEKWSPAPYELLVYHRGPLPADLHATLKPWIDFPKRANVEVTLVNLDEEVAPAHRGLWDQYAKYERTPWMLVRSQAKHAPDAPAWSGPCTAANVRNVIDSPMRQAILANLTRGASIVYVLMTSGDAKADRRVYDIARRELPLLEKKIKLEPQAEDGPNRLQWAIPLKVSFPLLVLDRTKPEEAAFAQILLGIEKDLDEVEGPILFPIFGRGLSFAMYGKHLDEVNLRGLTEMLCGKCTCDRKEQLGFCVDLLLAADWEDFQDQLAENKQPVPLPSVMPTSLPYREADLPIEKTDTPRNVEVPAPVDAQNPVDTPAPSPSIEAAPEEKPCSLCFWLWTATGVAGVLVVVTGGWVVLVLLRP